MIDLITTDKPNAQGITTVPKDKASYTIAECNMDHLNTYSDFTLVIHK